MNILLYTDDVCVLVGSSYCLLFSIFQILIVLPVIVPTIGLYIVGGSYRSIFRDILELHIWLIILL